MHGSEWGEAGIYLAFFSFLHNKLFVLCCTAVTHVQQDVKFGNPEHKLESVLPELANVRSLWAVWGDIGECNKAVAGKWEYRIPFVWKMQYQYLPLFQIFIKRIWSSDKCQQCPLKCNRKRKTGFFEKINYSTETKDALPMIPANQGALLLMLHGPHFL